MTEDHTHKQNEKSEVTCFQLSLSNCHSRMCSFLVSVETTERSLVEFTLSYRGSRKTNLLHYAAPIYPIFGHHFIPLMDGLILLVSWLQKLQQMIQNYVDTFLFFSSNLGWFTERTSQIQFRSQLTNGTQLLLILETETHK